MVPLLPRLTFDGLLSYVVFASGLVAGVAIFTPIMARVESGLSRSAN